MTKIRENIEAVELEKIRREWSKEKAKWYFSVVDVIGILTNSSDARNYWKVLKSRLKNTQNQLVTECNQLKMPSNDGKSYLTDTLDADMMLRLIKLISPGSASPFRLYFEQLENSVEGSYPQLKDAQEELMLMIDGYQENNIITIQAFVAGVDIEKLLISVTCNNLTIHGERLYGGVASVEEEKYAKNYSNQELSWGKFSRTIELPNEIEIDEASVSEHHGLLTVKLPIINKNRSRIVKVKTI